MVKQPIEEETLTEALKPTEPQKSEEVNDLRLDELTLAKERCEAFRGLLTKVATHVLFWADLADEVDDPVFVLGYAPEEEETEPYRFELAEVFGFSPFS